MKGWRELFLREVTSKIGDGLHGTPKYDLNGDYYFINGNNLSQGKIRIKEDTKRVSKEEYAKFPQSLSKKTILLSINGTIGNLALYNSERCMLGKSACFINIAEEYERVFFYYLFLNRDFQGYISEVATGTTIPNVPLKGIREFSFKLPPLPEQKAIAAVLSSLDEKIDLLHRQNATLEAMAEALFKQWFVVEAKEEWEDICVADVAYINTTTRNNKYPFDTIQYLDTGSLTDGLISDLQIYSSSKAPSRAQRIVKHNDILISTVRPNQKHYGIIKNPPENLIVSTGFCVLNCHAIDPHFLYLFLTTKDMTEYLHSVAEGSTSAYPSLKPSDIEKLELKRPPSNKLELFSTYSQSAWDKISENQTQIRTLEKLRDTLLPKLMSGEVRVAF